MTKPWILMGAVLFSVAAPTLALASSEFDGDAYFGHVGKREAAVLDLPGPGNYDIFYVAPNKSGDDVFARVGSFDANKDIGACSGAGCTLSVPAPSADISLAAMGLAIGASGFLLMKRKRQGETKPSYA